MTWSNFFLVALPNDLSEENVANFQYIATTVFRFMQSLLQANYRRLHLELCGCAINLDAEGLMLRVK